MFVILLKFSENKAQAPEFMQAHNEWIQKGFKEGAFLVVGSLQPKQGGAILAHNATLENIQKLVNEDPFVANKVVSAEVLEISPSKADDRLNFLIG